MRPALMRRYLPIIAAVVKSPLSLFGPWWYCPVCSFHGPFITVKPGVSSPRRFARCLGCGSLERHRLQWLVLRDIFSERDSKAMVVLHMAPEPFFETRFRPLFRVYETADLERTDVDYPHADLRALPFADATYDLVLASHVLEHVDNDRAALSEIARVLRPGGLAVLPVPIVSVNTIEYDRPNPREHGHVRAPGLDYYDRYQEYFSRIEIRTSGDYPQKYQVWTYEDRTNPSSPQLATPGERHRDFVPICYR